MSEDEEMEGMRAGARKAIALGLRHGANQCAQNRDRLARGGDDDGSVGQDIAREEYERAARLVEEGDWRERLREALWSRACARQVSYNERYANNMEFQKHNSCRLLISDIAKDLAIEFRWPTAEEARQWAEERQRRERDEQR